MKNITKINFNLKYELKFMSNAFSKSVSFSALKKTHDFESQSEEFGRELTVKHLRQEKESDSRERWESYRRAIGQLWSERDVRRETTIEWIVMKSSHDSNKTFDIKSGNTYGESRGRDGPNISGKNCITCSPMASNMCYSITHLY